MTFSRASVSIVAVWLLLLGGCATRQVNSPINHYDPGTRHQFQSRFHRGEEQDLVILAFSGGGTRAAAFSYGALEALRRVEIVSKAGRPLGGTVTSANNRFRPLMIRETLDPSAANVSMYLQTTSQSFFTYRSTTGGGTSSSTGSSSRARCRTCHTSAR